MHIFLFMQMHYLALGIQARHRNLRLYCAFTDKRDAEILAAGELRERGYETFITK